MKRHTLLLSLWLLAPPTLLSQQPLTASQREELRKKADEARERNAKEREQIQRGFAPAGVPEAAPARPMSVSSAQVCRATIAALMGHPLEIVHVTNEAAGIVFLTYLRPTDQTTWRNRCRVFGTAVVWASEPGRWRDHPADERVSFRVAGKTIAIRQQFADGSSTEKTFPLAAP